MACDCVLTWGAGSLRARGLYFYFGRSSIFFSFLFFPLLYPFSVCLFGGVFSLTLPVSLLSGLRSSASRLASRIIFVLV